MLSPTASPSWLRKSATGAAFVPRSVLRELLKKRKGSGAHRKTGQDLLGAALRFARVPLNPAAQSPMASAA